MQMFKRLTGISAVVFLLWLIWSSPSKVQASITIEQQINILDQEYSVTSTPSAQPADNSLGLIHWNGNNYNGETVYFEANLRCTGCNGGNAKAVATLYTKAGNAVTGAVIDSNTGGTYELKRTAAITGNLVNGTDYTVRLTLDADSGTAVINQAKLIIIQTGDEITDTETQIEIGNNTTTSNSDFALMSSPKVIRYDSYYYNPSPTIYFEASLKSSAEAGTAYAGLSSSGNCSSILDDSTVSVTGQSWSLVRSDEISPTSGSAYFVCLKATAETTGYIANAKLVISQSSQTKIDSMLLYHPLINTLTVTNSSDYTVPSPRLNYTPGSFNGAHFSRYFEATVKSDNGSAEAGLYNFSSSTEISGSTVSTLSSAYGRLRSNSLPMPIVDSELAMMFRNANQSNTSVSGANLLTYVYQDPELKFVINEVPSGTQTNGVTTNRSSYFNRLDFDHLEPLRPAYMAHQLQVTTNANSGYTVTVKMTDYMQGGYPGNNFDEFPTTWENPIAWYHPDGTAKNVNSGWIGANTSDTRVTGWSDASGKFGPLGTVSNVVMYSPTADPGTSVYVTYAVEVNKYQPTDLYAGGLIYNILPTY